MSHSVENLGKGLMRSTEKGSTPRSTIDAVWHDVLQGIRDKWCCSKRT